MEFNYTKYLECKDSRTEAKEAKRKAEWSVEAELAKMGYGEYIGIVTDKSGVARYDKDDFYWLTRNAGCRYEDCSGLLTPVSNLNLESSPFLIVPVHWSELLEADYENCRLSWKVGSAKEALKNHTYSFPQAKFESTFVGAEGDKVEIDVKLRRVTGFKSNFGYTRVYTFEDAAHNLIVWKTGKSLGLKEGSYVHIAGTIKEHSEFRGKKQTVLTRCKVVAAA